MPDARLTAGAAMFETEPIGGRPLRMSDGTCGIGGLPFDERETALCTPCGTALAASWDAGLVEAIGRLVGGEARRRGVDVVLGPVLNLPRSPLGGRTFEGLGEDPLLAGRLGAAWIAGLQSLGVAATPKHFVANDAETRRTHVDCVVDERALRELYLTPFEHAARAGAWALMAAYNRLNGTPCTEHAGLLTGVLKGEWGWDGVVMSDWFAAHSTVACAEAGLDLEMPGPGRVLGEELGAAVDRGEVEPAVLDDKLARLERLAGRVGRARAEPPPDPQGLLREAAAAGFVLLRNEGPLLPLAPARRIAVIGPAAARPSLQGGGTSWVSVAGPRDPLAAIAARFGADVVHEPGCTQRVRPAPLHELAAGPITVEYLAHGAVAAREQRATSHLVWLGTPPAGADRVRVTGRLAPRASGAHAFSVRGSGPARLRVAGAPVASLDPEPGDSALFSAREGRAEVSLHAGVEVPFEAELEVGAGGLHRVELACAAPEPADRLERAAAAAAAADVAILLVGTGDDIEAESVDRATTALPGEQEELGRRVLAANPRTVVVVNAGGAVDLAWARAAPVVLYAWFGGQEMADALAAVLAGDLEPGGRLPLTLAREHADWPAYDTTPDAGGRLAYRESLLVGYRHFDARGLDPEFCFGHGLGYTEFAYERLSVSGLRAEVTVRNAGARPGKEVVQLYVEPPGGPPRALRAFAAVTLAPGEARTVALGLDERAFSRWDGGWRVVPGEHAVLVGRSSRDLKLRAPVRVG
ncbi:MAG TPA: glycoside hydrolase family 3 C-terminal domain-containing protein [Solirubrobacteraceae bacterium]